MKKRTFSKEFKMQVVNLILQDHLKVETVAEKFALHPVMVYRWVREYEEYGTEAFAGKGNQRAADAELRKLKKENCRLKMENEILKKAAAYFAEHPEPN